MPLLLPVRGSTPAAVADPIFFPLFLTCTLALARSFTLTLPFTLSFTIPFVLTVCLPAAAAAAYPVFNVTRVTSCCALPLLWLLLDMAVT
jgi:hypothetical protein